MVGAPAAESSRKYTRGLRSARTLQCEAFVRERFNQIYQHVNKLFVSFDLTDTAAHHDSI